MEKLNKQVSGPYNSVANVLPTSCIYKSIFLTGGRKGGQARVSLQIVQGVHNTKLETACSKLKLVELSNGNNL